MRFPLTGVALSLAVFFLVGSGATLKSNPQDCIAIEDFDEDTDYFPQKFVAHQTTDLFEISYHKTYKVVTNKFQDKSYLLYMCGTPPPPDEIASGKHHLILPVPNPPIHRRRWFRNVYTEAVGFLSECNAPSEIDEPYVPAEAECSPLVRIYHRWASEN